jgi:hypothetical protein
MLRACIILVTLNAAALGQTGFAGPEACRECHDSQYEKQSRSHHANALKRIAQSPVAQSLGARDPAVVSLFQWAFGAGAQGITPVGISDGRYFEHRYSFYKRPGDWAITFGHPERANSPESQLGIFQDGITISRCFNCHATGVQPSASGPDLSAIREGVTCERCHGPGAAHIALAKSGAAPPAVRRALVNPGRFPAKARVEMCGECHRLPSLDSMVPEPEIMDPVSVRLAPVGLMASRCFQQSKRLSCLTCHDPHADARARSDTIYTAICKTCHEARAAAKSHCPRPAVKDCVSCHMPVASLGPYLRFTDHRIRSK